jgi:hypothetical protein
MCLYAMDVEAAVLPGPYSDEAAAAFARAQLLPVREFAAWLDQPDEWLASRFGVPVIEVARRRIDLASGGTATSEAARG